MTTIEVKNTDTIWRNGRFVTMDTTVDGDYGLLMDHDLVTRENKIVGFVPKSLSATSNHIVDLKNALVTPGFIDCHTHIVFGGNRAKEWEMRLNGVPYTQIAQEGGGINSTVRQTRALSEDALYDLASKRMLALANEGVTTVESKSGYGLDLENERKQLTVSRKLAQNFPIDIAATLLSAHTVPPEYQGKADEYVNEICNNIMPTLWQEGLFEAVDVFCESVGFTLEQTRKVYEAAKKLGIPVKGHMEQMSNLGGSSLVAEYNGLSVDHIEYLDEAAIEKMSHGRTVATLLPLAFYFLRETKVPPVALLRKYKVPMAVSTDFNPGTSPFTSIRFAMNAACVQFGLTPQEVLTAVTRNAAQALGRENTHGQLKAGFEANFAVWNVNEPVEIFYELGYNPLTHVVFAGKFSINKADN